MSNSKTEIGSPTRFFNLVTLVFVALRACEIVQWPWYIVLLPSIVAYAVVIIFVIIVGIFALVDENILEEGDDNER